MNVRLQALRVLIVAKTRRGTGACVGGITTAGRSVRLEAVDAAEREHAGMEYAVGDVWELEVLPQPPVTPPHVENVIVYGGRRDRSGVDPIPLVERFMPPKVGGVEALYDGLAQRAPGGALYISERTGIPPYSTTFWRPDQPLHMVDNDGVRLRYRYPDRYQGGDECCTLVFVGFQEPLEVIPAGTLLRVSLAHWWRPRDVPDEELRCYLQLSGWLLPQGQEQGRAIQPLPVAQAREQAGIGQAAPSQAAPSQAIAVRAGSGSPSRQEPRKVLKDVFGYDEFRPLQEEIIGALLTGKDTIAVMPTGSGKSLCYQIPALLWERTTVVVSPLIALMQDQVDALRLIGAPAAFLNSSLSYAERRMVMDQVRDGTVKLLYTSPETLLRPEVLHLLDQAGVDCLAVDEAHCISQWGHEFRPEYRQLEPVRRRFAAAVCLALTATATDRVRADIRRSLGMDKAREFVAEFDRPNLFLAARPRSNGRRQLASFLANHRGQPGIIYCTTRRDVDSLAAWLSTQGYSALPYHAGMDDESRRQNQRSFVRDEAQIVVATIAFGMGINKSNVRFVVHYNLPSSVEGYYQEIGRAGRDGLRADCLLLYDMQDVILHRQMIDKEGEELRAGRSARLDAMLRLAQAQSCRRPQLLRYFGEQPTNERCDFCDNCLAHGDEPPDEVTEAARKFFECVQRTGQVFGVSHITKVLRGSGDNKITKLRHDRLPVYGSGREYSVAQWRELAQQWIQQGLLVQDMEHGGLALTGRGMAVLRGEEAAYARLEPQAEEQAEPLQGAAAGQPEYDPGLFEHLRGLRIELAREVNLPPYVIFSDRALAEMAAYLPHDEAEFLLINGVGRSKLALYGAQFLAAIRRYSAEHGLQPQPRPGAAMRPSPQPRQKGSRTRQVAEMFAAGHSLTEVQELCGIARSTVIEHLRKHLLDGGQVDAARLVAESRLTEQEQGEVLACFDRLGTERMIAIYEACHGAYEYNDLHLLRVVWLARQAPG